MKMSDVTVVRIYLHEESSQLHKVRDYLRNKEKLRGVTVFRGISGFGDSGVPHEAMLVDLSLDLPIVVEFFDTPAKVDKALEHLETLIKPGHILSWSARVNEKE